MGADKEQLAIVAWALALAKGGASSRAQRQKLDKRSWRLAATFALSPLERHLVELAWAAEASTALADLLRQKGGLTVERARALLDDAEVDAALSPSRPLRRHALVAVDGGMPAADARLRLAPGLLARLGGAPEPTGLALGMTRLAPGARGDVPARVLALLADRAGDAAETGATLWTLDGCARRQAHELGRGLARHLGRGVLVVDGELVAGAPDAALLLACARREADCDGDLVIVVEAAALGERYLALLAPGAGARPPLVVLCAEERTRDPVHATPFAVRRLSLHAPAAKAPIEAPPEEPKPPIDDGLEEVRRRAIRDAERALGIFRAEPARPIEPPRPVEPARPVAPARAVDPPRAPAREAAPPPVETGKKRSAKGAQYFGGEYSEASAAPPRAAAAPAPAPVTATATPTPPPPPPATTERAPSDGAALPLPENASVDDLARACATSPSAEQRIELIGRIRTVKSPAVIAALRANAQSAHAGVRAVAEAAMAALFGPTWNTVRPVPKPLQPPRSED